MNGGRVANLYRLIAALLFAFVPLSSFADGGAFPATTASFDTSSCNGSIYPPLNPPADNPVWTCQAATGSQRSCGYSHTYQGASWFIGYCTQTKAADTCPAGANSSTGPTGESLCTCTAGLRPVNGQCVATPSCPDGQHEEGGACVPNSCKANETRVNGVCVPEPACPNGETRVNGVCQKSNCKTGATGGYYDMTSAASVGTCSHNGAGQYCSMIIEHSSTAYFPDGARYYGIGRLTGSSCAPAPDGPGSPTPTDPPKPSDPNAPKPTQPATPGAPAGGSPGPTRPGSSPGTDGSCPPDSYKSNGSCYPKNPTPESPDADGKCPVGTIKVGSVCAILQPAPDKDPDEKEKPSVFGGACNAVACEGDAIQCAIVREQYRMNCKLFDNDSDSSSLTNRALNGSDSDSAAAIKGRAEQVSVSSFDQSGFGWSRSCPADPSFEVAGESFDIPFSKVCGVLGVLSNGALGLTLLSCLMWVVGRKD